MVFLLVSQPSCGPLLFAGGVLLLSVMASTRTSSGQEVVASLVDAMTLDEKLSLLHGARDPSRRAGAGYVPGVPRLGIPELRLTDGPAGIRTSEPATALPAPIMLGATFDTDRAHQYGTVLGREGRARGQDVLLGPMVNLIRVPQAGRNFETFSEDPVLTRQMVGQEVRGIEGEGLIATVKHYIANNFEEKRDRVSAEIDERTLREMYLPGFRGGIEAGAGSVMAAYNRVNGTFSCDHDRLLTDVLKRELGFEGWIMSDWFAPHTLGALQAGLDQEMPGLDVSIAPQAVYFDAPLRAAVESGRIPEEEVDASVSRILTQMNRKGLLEAGRPGRPDLDPNRGASIAWEVAVSGAVLLQNKKDTLPLADTDLSSVAVIGPTAKRPLAGGGGTSRVTAFQLESPVEALRRRLGPDVSVRYEDGLALDGVPVPSSALAPSEQISIDGLRRETANNTVQIDSEIDFTGDDGLPNGSAWEWTGTLTAPVTGRYDLMVQTSGGGARLSVDGEPVVSTHGFYSDAGLLATADGLQSATATLELTEGEARSITVTAEGRDGVGSTNGEALQVRLAWVSPRRRQAARAEAVETAREADATIVFGYNEGREGTDRASLALPSAQDALIDAVAEASDDTAVVLNTCGPIQMPWQDDVEAILQMWYPGQEGGDATAAVVLGDVAPGGRLPVTFPQSEDDAPTHPTERYPGISGRAQYSESVFVGYRWYEAQDIDPLFPFGHGLSYTTIEYSDLTIHDAETGPEVTVHIRNTGERAGTAVPQVYVGPPVDPPVPMAPKELGGFDRVRLEPGEEEVVTIPISQRAYSYWSVEHDEWRVAAGRRPLYVGASSQEIRLEGTLDVA